MATRKSLGLWSLAVLVSAALVVWLILPVRWTDPIWYSAKYWVAASQVHWVARPTGCEGCRYQKVVTAYNVDGQPVAGDDVPRCKHDLRVGRNLISYDGRSWTPLPLGKSCPDLKVNSVQITWTKVR